MKSFAITVAVAALRPVAVAAVHSGTSATEHRERSIGDIATKSQAHRHAGGVRKRRREESHQHSNSIVSLLDDEYIEETICFDTDDRVASNDVRIGRFKGRSVCTAWLISEDVIVTAGHCVDEEKQANAPRGWVVEFNVPRSTSSGYPVNSIPEDKYNVRFDQGGMHPEFEDEWFDSEDGGFDYIGNDWAVGRLLPNEITGLKAGEQQGCWFNLEYDGPANRQEIRITGYGTNKQRNIDFIAQTTHVGPYRDVADKSNPYILRYATDTTGGNSGGPVINEATGAAIGIHTNAGCRASGSHNHGMSNHQPMFVSAVSRYLGVTDPASDQIRSPVCPGNFPGNPPREPTSSPTRAPTTSSPTQEPTSSPTFEPTLSRGPTLSPVPTPPPSLDIPILSTLSPTYAHPTGSGTLQPDPTRPPTSSTTRTPTQKPSLKSEPRKKKSREPGRRSNSQSPTQKPSLKSEPRKKKSREPGRRSNSRAKKKTRWKKKKRERNNAVSGAHGLSSVSGSRQQ